MKKPSLLAVSLACLALVAIVVMTASVFAQSNRTLSRREVRSCDAGQYLYWDATPGAWKCSATNPGTVGVTAALPLTPDYGGTGIASYAVGDLVYATGATTMGKLADVATGNVLLSGGLTTAPSYGKVGLTTHVSGILPTANGGTGIAYFTAAGPTAARVYTFPDKADTVLTATAATFGDMGAEPACAVGNRGQLWVAFGGAGVADTVKVCTKDAGDAYAWRALF